MRGRRFSRRCAIVGVAGAVLAVGVPAPADSACLHAKVSVSRKNQGGTTPYDGCVGPDLGMPHRPGTGVNYTNPNAQDGELSTLTVMVWLPFPV